MGEEYQDFNKKYDAFSKEIDLEFARLGNIEEKIKEIYQDFMLYAPQEYAKQTEPGNMEEIDIGRFGQLVFEGYKSAQMKILTEIRIDDAKLLSLNADLKSARRQKNKQLGSQIESEIRASKYRIAVFKNMAFSILWMCMKGKREVIARFYTGEEGANQLTGVGFKAMESVAAEINADPNRFCLFSDLTSNIQIGDLIVFNSLLTEFEVLEIKSGKKNEEARRIIEFRKLNKIEIDKTSVEDMFGKHMARQVVRMNKQDEKMERLNHILQNDSGYDPKGAETMVFLPTGFYQDETYHPVLFELIQTLYSSNKDHSYTCIEGVLHIGVYRNKMRLMGRFLLDQLTSSKVYNLTGALGILIAEPIFAKGLPYRIISDLISGRTQILISVNIEAFIQLSNELKFPVRWSTKKEFESIAKNASINTKELFSVNSRGLVYDVKSDLEGIVFIGMGMFIRMIFDHIKPSSIILNRRAGFIPKAGFSSV